MTHGEPLTRLDDGFAAIPAGWFQMGSDDGSDDERPVHRVWIDAFEVALYPVTCADYDRFLRVTSHEPPRDWQVYSTIPDRPVVGVSWLDCQAYCRWLEAEGAPVRLPTEAEWERAARGLLHKTRYPWGDDVDATRANFLPDPALKRHRGTRPVGCYAPNGLQLYDMAGNVWQWVADWYRPDAYRTEERRNPRGPGTGSMRIVRGGSWVSHDVDQLRCAHRHKVPPDTYAYSIGFRVVYSDDGSE